MKMFSVKFWNECACVYLRKAATHSSYTCSYFAQIIHLANKGVSYLLINSLNTCVEMSKLSFNFGHKVPCCE